MLQHRGIVIFPSVFQTLFNHSRLLEINKGIKGKKGTKTQMKSRKNLWGSMAKATEGNKFQNHY